MPVNPREGPKESIKPRPLKWRDIWNVVPGNLVPLLGALFLGWDGWEIVLFFYIETMIIGVVHAVKLAISRPGRQESMGGEKKPMSPAFATILFVGNYGLFTAIQLGIFWDSIVFPPMTGEEGFSFWISVAGLLAARLTAFIAGFLLPRQYLTARVDHLFFQPYPRIFVQQVFAILGAFVIAVAGGNSWVALVSFIVIKTACELYIATFWDVFLERKIAKEE